MGAFQAERPWTGPFLPGAVLGGLGWGLASLGLMDKEAVGVGWGGKALGKAPPGLQTWRQAGVLSTLPQGPPPCFGPFYL